MSVAEDLIAKARAIAEEAHAGQVDKAGAPYVAHPIRVMEKVSTPIQKVVALLHDVVEDCPGWTFERLAREGFPEEVLAPLRLVTKDPDADLSDWEAYFEFIDRCATHPDAAAVKLADLEDNMDLVRIPNPNAKDFKRLEKYQIAHERLASGQGRRT